MKQKKAVGRKKISIDADLQFQIITKEHLRELDKANDTNTEIKYQMA
jgi:hypothetical protein